HDRSLCNGLSVRSVALGFAESGFDSGDDRQSDQCGVVADGIAITSAAINAGRSWTIEKFTASADGFSGGLPCGRCRDLDAGRLGVVHPNCVGSCRDCGAIDKSDACAQHESARQGHQTQSPLKISICRNRESEEPWFESMPQV